MSEPAKHMLVGIRPAGEPHGLIQWVSAGDLPLRVEQRVVVGDESGAWVGEVVVAPSQLVERSPAGVAAQVVRLAEPGEWPTTEPGAGSALLAGLGLPVGGSGGPRAAEQH